MNLHPIEVGAVGLELSAKTPEKQGADSSDGANSGALSDDSALAAWLNQCPVKLTDDVRRAVLAIVQRRDGERK